LREPVWAGRVPSAHRRTRRRARNSRRSCGENSRPGRSLRPLPHPVSFLRVVPSISLRTDLMRSFRFTFFIVDQEMSSSFASSRNVLSGTGSPPTSMSRRSVRAPPPRKTTEPVAGGRLDAAFGVASIAEFNLLNSRTSAEISGAGRHRRLAQSCQRSLTRRLHRAAAATDARNSTMCFKVLSKKNDPPDPNKNLWRRARFQLAFMVGPWQAAQAASDQPYRPAGRRLRDNQRFRRRRFLSS
jgi:hypothetical protein